MEQVKFKPPRKRNFLDLEVSMIIEELSVNKQIYVGKFSPLITKETKLLAWEALAEKINAICGQARTGKDLEKKWYNIQATAVREVGQYSKEMKKTGGGPHPKIPTENAIKIVDNIVNPAKVVGIPGGVDSFMADGPTCSISELVDIPTEVVTNEAPEEANVAEKRTASVDNLLQKLGGFSDRNAKTKEKKCGSKAIQDSMSDILELEKRKLPSEEDKDLDRDFKILQIKKIKLEIESIEKSTDIECKIKEKELEYKQALISMVNLKAAVLRHELAAKEQITYIVENAGLIDN